jgi:hypothetical protein
VRSWLWMLRRFGLRRTLWYWEQGRFYGWQSKEESEVFLHEFLEGPGQSERERYQRAMAAVLRIRSGSN